VRIPGGDLAPARRRRYGGSFGRRRHRRNVRVATGLLLVVVGGGAAYLLQRDDASAPVRRQAAALPSACPTRTPGVTAPTVPTKALVLPQPQQVSLRLLNGTPRNGLAKAIGDQLAAQGFHVTQQANAPAALVGASTVTYGPGAAPAGVLVSHWVLGARLVPGPAVARGSVQVVLGSSFQRLATPAEASAAVTAPRAAAAPTAAPTRSASGCPT
jgi:hypothetical protein